MPWDGTTLWHGAWTPGTAFAPTAVAGGIDESISQPRFRPDGTLVFLTDASGFWCPTTADGTVLAPPGFDYGNPDWQFGQSLYGFTPSGDMFAVRHEPDGERLGAVVGVGAAAIFTPFDLPFGVIHAMAVDATRLVLLAGSATDALAIVSVDRSSGRCSVVQQSRPGGALPVTVSLPRAIHFPGGDGHTSHAYYYPPANEIFTGLPDELPPLIVLSHGGPTSACSPVYDVGKQFFTSRGIAVCDVNYGGSTGYGRVYRNRLRGTWGILDVQDCVAAAQHLVAQGLADPKRLVIRGGSAGGYTTLQALATTTVFAAGASHYGVSDLALLASDTHKFESRYLDRLVGPYPAAADVYTARSPLAHADRITCPVIFFQGLDDPVVPPNQAERMVDALKSRNVPVTYLTFEGTAKHSSLLIMTLKYLYFNICIYLSLFVLI